MKKMKTLSVQVEDIICFDVPKRGGVLQLEGVLQLGGIQYAVLHSENHLKI